MEVRLSSALCYIFMCLTGSSVGPTSTSSAYGPLDVSLLAPDVVTVNIPVSLFCSSRCSPACSFSISAGERSADATQLFFTLTRRIPHVSVSCTARNNATRRTATTRKTLRVMQGPENVTVRGPVSLAVGQTHRFRCSAVCWPSCNYTWTSDGLPLSGSGNEVFLTPSPAVTTETLVCTATNNVTGIFASAVRKLRVTGSASAGLQVNLLPVFLAGLIHFPGDTFTRLCV